MELRQLEAFVEAAQRGSISRAAQALYLTQPSLTQRVRALEQELGQQLLVRSRTGVRPTPAGRLFLPRAQAALAALRRGEDELKDMREATGGRLGIAAAPDVATYLLPAALGRFAAEHPAVEVSLHTGPSVQMAAALLADEVELALVNRPVRLPDVCGERLFEDRLVPVAASGHPLTMAHQATLGAFAAAGLVMREPASCLHELTMAYFGAHELTPVVRVRTGTTETVKRLVAAGVGVGLLPTTCVQDELAVGTLAPVRLEETDLPARGTWALQRDGSRPSGAVRAFLAALGAAVPRAKA